MEFENFITGFTDGEGSFCVSFNRRSKMVTNIEVRPSFSISQHRRNLPVLKEIRNYFGVGFIRFSKKDQNYKYEVRSINDLTKVIIPHFEKYRLKTSKKNDFLLFSKICKLVVSKHHLNKKYLNEVIDLAYQMNCAGKRKYKKQVLLKFISKS